MERYDNLDGLRAISCIGIIAMHIRANTNYQVSGWVYDSFIPSMTHLVPLFLILSGFGMFCGYYEKVKSGKVNWNLFYSKRYKKILPFFAFLILIDLVIERSVAHLIEGLTEATLVFGLLPNNSPSVIGVCWTLGVIFLFYMLFPFFVWLCWTKRRAWASLVASCIIVFFCSLYFFRETFVVSDFVARHSFIYCAPFFIGGGIVYLNRDTIKDFVSRHRCLCLVGCVSLTISWYFIPDEVANVDTLMLKNLILFLSWLCYAISVNSKILNNKVMRYLSGISLELYLAQMLIFRVIEKAKCLYLFGTGWISFLVVWIAVIIGMIVFIEIFKQAKSFIAKRI